MLAKRIIPCLDVRNKQVVKGIKFREHAIVGDVLSLTKDYIAAGADELVFYDITASSEARTVDHTWIKDIARLINIPFCVAGGITSIDEAEKILFSGADKISINSPALANPGLIDELVDAFGQQCIVIGIDSLFVDGKYIVCQYTGDVQKTLQTPRTTESWIREVQQRGAGEIVLNCMDHDGVRTGYDLEQLAVMRDMTTIPLIASGGAGSKQDFADVFLQANVDGALAASVFHKKIINIIELKRTLKQQNIEVRL